MSDKVLCPKCGSDQLSANKKGFSGKKAVAGAILTGGVGLLAGTIGSNEIKVTCIACGNEWTPKQYQDQKQSQKDTEMIYWKAEFYRLYESNNIEAAKRQLLKNETLSRSTPDVHEAYKKLKSSDSRGIWMFVFIVVVIGIVAYIIFK